MTRNSKRYQKPEPNKALEAITERVKTFAPREVSHSHYDGGHRTEQVVALNIRSKSITIGLPMDELMFSKFFTNYLGLNIMPWDKVITTASTYLPDARNQIHNIFLEKGDEHILMLDSDVLPPPNFIEALLAHDLPIVGGWYRKKEKYGYKDLDGNVHVTQRPVVYDLKDVGYIQRTHPGKGLEKVDGAGAGAWLMRRDVAEALGQSPYDMQGGGEDLRLCDKIRELGFDMYIDWNLPCAHCGVFFV